MDFIAVISMLATGFFAGSTTVTWAGYQLEKKHNAKLEKEQTAMSLAVDLCTTTGCSYIEAFDQIMNASYTRSK